MENDKSFPESPRLSSRYCSYLLRMWQVEQSGEWRFSVHNVATGEQHGFSDLESLFTFLQAQTEDGRTSP